MALNISAVLFLGVIVYLFIRKGGMKPWHAVVCSLLGFYLAETALAPGIQSGGDSVAQMIATFNF